MISNKTKTEDANKEFDALRHEIIADAKDKKNKSEQQAQVLIFINTWHGGLNKMINHFLTHITTGLGLWP